MAGQRKPAAAPKVETASADQPAKVGEARRIDSGIKASLDGLRRRPMFRDLKPGEEAGP